MEILEAQILFNQPAGAQGMSVFKDNLYIRFWFVNGLNGGSFLRVINKNDGTFISSQNIGSFTSEILSTEDFAITNPETEKLLISETNRIAKIKT